MKNLTPEAGELNRRVTIEAPTIARDGAFGGETIAEPWPVLATVWARVTEIITDESDAGGVRVGLRRAVFRIRYRSDVNVTTAQRMRIGYAGRKFRLIGDPTEVGQKEALDMLAEAYSV